MFKMPVTARAFYVLGLVIVNLPGCGTETPAFRDQALPAGEANAVVATPSEVTDSGARNEAGVDSAQQGSSDNNTNSIPNSIPPDNGSVQTDEQEPPACAQGAMLARSKQVIDLSWAPRLLSDDMSVALENRNGAYTGGLGAVAMVSATTLRYTAPQAVNALGDIAIIVSRGDAVIGECLVRLVPDESIGVPDDGLTRGLVGSVYNLTADSKELPDFSMMTAIGDIVAQNLDVPNRAFDYGFPGVDENLIEWFGLRFQGQLAIERAGTYDFRLTADDGARLYIDDQLVVDNDGLHSVKSVNGKISLAKGMHTIRVDYFQGPRYYIALQLLWRPAGSGAAFTIVPPEVLSRPATNP